MTKITTYLAGVSLAIVFLVAAQVNADTIRFSFTQCLAYSVAESGNTMYRPIVDDDFGPTGNTYGVRGDYREIGKSFELTATSNGDNKIDFSLTSTWTGGKDGGTGNLMSLWYTNHTPTVYFRNISGLLDSGSNIANSFGMTAFYPPEGFTLGENGTSVLDFTVDLAAGKTWSDFNDLAYSGEFSTLIHLGNLVPILNGYSYASFITIANDAVANAPDDNSSPEPATLAVLGLGLAGLGLVSRRRRK